MPKLWRSLFRGSEERADPTISMQDWYEQMTYQGLGYLLTGTTTSADTESIENSFLGYINGLYKSNGIVFACMEARRSIFSEARFQYQRMRNGRPGDLFGTAALNPLEYPWPNGTTGELLSRAIQDVDLTGNHFVVREPGRLRRLRPDWVQIILTAPPDQAVESDVAGYVYWPGGINYSEPKIYLPEEVAHWCPIPDPEAQYRGMSWLTPVLREIQADKQATDHKARFYANAATPKLSVSLKDNVTKAQFLEFMEAFEAANGGIENAYKTIYLGGGADVNIVGANMQQLDFKQVQGAGETRIAAAAGVPSVVVGFSEGMQGSSLNAGNYKSAKESFADKTMRPLWRSISAAYQPLVVMPSQNGTVRLWYDDRDIAFLRTDRLEAAKIQTEKASNIVKLIQAGFEPDSVVKAVDADDMSLLKHSGLVSVQLLPPGESGTDAEGQPTGAPPAKPPAGQEKPAPAGDVVPKAPARHGNKGDPGYSLLHPGTGGGNGIGISTKDHLSSQEEDTLREDLDKAFYGGYSTKEYNAFTDPGSHLYDPDEELSEGQTSVIDWDGLSRYYADNEDQTWYSNFEGSRSIRRAGNEWVGLDQTDHDALIGTGESNRYDRTASFGMVLGLATSKPLDQPLYRGSYIEGADPDDVMKAFDVDHMDFSLISFTNSQGVADYFGDPSLYDANFGKGAASSGTKVKFVVAPGAQGTLGHLFPENMKAGDPGTDLNEVDEDDEDYDPWASEPDVQPNTDPAATREIVTGGRFKVRSVKRDGDTITVDLSQEFTYNPVTGRTT